MRILIADTDSEYRASIVKFLEEQQHKVEEAISLNEVIQKCKSKCPDLILIDDNLSGTNGVDAVKAIRQLGGDATWNPIVIMYNTDSTTSAATITALITDGVDAGADDCLPKPLDLTVLKYRMAAAQRLQSLKEDVFTIAHELVLANHALEVGATQDSMTGMLDIQSLHKAIEKEWVLAQKNKTVLSLLLLNLDNFRSFNEIYGSNVGDDSIKKIATAIKRAIPKNYKILARTIGDTFALLMPNTSKAKALEIAKALHKAVDALKIPNSGSHLSDHVTCSVGVGSTEGEVQKNSLELMEAADFALYQAKHKGRNKVYAEPEKAKNSL
jgi:diguanylate cyclase (GGDEF)-like protein